MKIHYQLPFSILVLFQCFISFGQIVNIETARMQSDTTGWMGGAGANATIAKNTQNIFILNTDVHLQYKTKKDLWLILASTNLLKAGEERFFNNTFLHLRYNRKINNLLRWEIFAQAQNNQVTQIDSRFLVGTGPRFKILSTKVIRLYAASLVMYEREKEKTDPVVRHSDIRNSSYASFTITPSPHIEIISTTFYQPLFKNFGDYRWLNQSVFKLRATKHLSMYLRWNYLYDRFPAGTAPRTTYNLSSGIEYDF
jgi:hypothetical protein